MFQRAFLLLLFASFTSLCLAQVAPPVAGQNPAPAAAPPVAPGAEAARFQAMNERYKSLDKQLDEIATTFATATSAAQQAELKKKYTTLVAEIEQAIPQLQQAAEAAFLAQPNVDPAVTDMLLASMWFDYRRDDFEPALRLAKLLAEHKCTNPALNVIAGKAAFQCNDYAAAEYFLGLANESGKIDDDAREFLAELPEQKKQWEIERAIRAREAAADNLPRVKFETTKGTIVLELFEDEAPQAVANFINLVEKKFYDGTPFHRVLGGFMAQGGDPTGTGTGGPGYKIYCECDQLNYRHHFRGSLSMAHAGKNTGGSQFFLTFRPTTHLDGRHTCFGRVIEGMDVLAKLQRVDPSQPTGDKPDKIIKAEVLRKRGHVYEPTKVK
jgi:cyclophilin family peptidyl-prolyl cis-trans isomerase